MVYIVVSGPLRAELQHTVTHLRKVKHISDKRLWSFTNLSRYGEKKRKQLRAVLSSQLLLCFDVLERILSHRSRKAWGKPKGNYHLILTVCLEDIRNVPKEISEEEFQNVKPRTKNAVLYNETFQCTVSTLSSTSVLCSHFSWPTKSVCCAMTYWITSVESKQEDMNTVNSKPPRHHIQTPSAKQTLAQAV